jgi:hypothetical protein
MHMPDKSNQINTIRDTQSFLTDHLVEYWRIFSSFHTWPFWLNIAMLILPLVFLYFYMDRTLRFRLAVYGLSTAGMIHYFDNYFVMRGYWFYLHQIIPLPPSSLAISVSLPVLLLFAYQYSLKNKRNYWLCMIPMTAMIAFIFKPIMVMIGFLEIYKGFHVFHVFVLGLIVITAAKLLMNVLDHWDTTNNESYTYDP